MDNRPIGIFDSGLGGLTVVKEVMKQLTNESIVYFGDTARVPYGNKSKSTVTKFSAQIIRFLLSKDVKAIIIACNTVNSNCAIELRELFPELMIEGVVGPGVIMASRATKNGRIGVIGTEGTVKSGRYAERLREIHPEYQIFSKACPLFVPLVEDGWTNTEVAKMVIATYLNELLEEDIDTLILGCTHYPILSEDIQAVVGKHIKLINPANETAYQMGLHLLQENIQAIAIPSYHFYVSDHKEQMQDMAKMFLGCKTPDVIEVDIEKY